MQLYLLSSLTFLLFLITGCNQENTTHSIIPDVTNITIDENNISLYPTDPALALSASAHYSDNTTALITNVVKWSSSNAQLLQLTNNLVQAKENGGDTNVTIKYDTFTDKKPVHLYKLTSYQVKYPDINTTGSYIFEALGNFDNNETNRTIITNIFWNATNRATIELSDDGKATITFANGETNVSVTMFEDENASSPIAPWSKVFTLP